LFKAFTNYANIIAQMGAIVQKITQILINFYMTFHSQRMVTLGLALEVTLNLKTHEVIWWLRSWCISMRFLAQTLMDVYINVYSVYTLIHHVQM
jgi:hypothetical protein